MKLLVAGLVLGVVAALLLVPLYRELHYIDRHSGAQYGYREWIGGWRTGEWQEDSALATYMQRAYPTEFQHDWVSYSGKLCNALGMPLLQSHKSGAGPILFLQPRMADPYVQGLTEMEKRRMYDVLASDDEAAIKALEQYVWRGATGMAPPTPRLPEASTSAVAPAEETLPEAATPKAE